MPGAESYQYALWRVVPDLQRGETLNAGVILYCRRHGFLEARVRVDHDRFQTLAPALDPRAVADHLDGMARVAGGDPGAGELAQLGQSERFGWLVAPASTLVQPGSVHTGLCADPAELLERLFARLVL